MTARAFFDKGIYKSVLKRFFLGSVLYFIMLFLCTSMLVLLAYEPSSAFRESSNYMYVLEELTYPAMCMAFVVPTVVALLCYRFVHSKKTSIFVHSLPVTRWANYISTLAGAFTLMALPVILNGVILALLSSFGGYGYLFSVHDTVVWTLFNLLTLFIMFSVSTFAAMCTGNSFSLIVINAILIFAPLLIASITETILLEFLYGYSYKRNLLEFASEINPAYFITTMADDIVSENAVDLAAMAGFIVLAIILYAASYFVYKIRRTETSEDVAGFKILNPIFKYFVTFVGTIAIFSLFSEFMGEKSVLFTFIVILASVIFYFGSEMILKKTIKVWHSYKGYLAFGGVFTAFILFLGLTSVFGYETYVPEFDEIEEAAIYNYYYQDEEPFTQNEELNRYILKVHQELVKSENRPILNHDEYHDTRLHITYKLKNGKIITRRYGIGRMDNSAIMTEVYKYNVYKEACEAVFDDNIKEITSIEIAQCEVKEKPEVLAELLECIKADVYNLSYYEISVEGGANCYIRFIPVKESNYENRIVMLDNFENLDTVVTARCYISAKYTNTLNWLDDNDYGHIRGGLLNSLYSGLYETIQLGDLEDVEITYHTDSADIDFMVEDEADIEALKDIFNGYYDCTKNSYKEFDENVSVSFGNNEVWFCPALDGSNSFRVRDTDEYISLTDKEMEQFKAISEKYGMVLPIE